MDLIADTTSLVGLWRRQSWARDFAIGQDDLWIAAVALQENLPLLSRNLRHFGKIAGLEVMALAGD